MKSGSDKHQDEVENNPFTSTRLAGVIILSGFFSLPFCCAYYWAGTKLNDIIYVEIPKLNASDYGIIAAIVLVIATVCGSTLYLLNYRRRYTSKYVDYLIMAGFWIFLIGGAIIFVYFQATRHKPTP